VTRASSALRLILPLLLLDRDRGSAKRDGEALEDSRGVPSWAVMLPSSLLSPQGDALVFDRDEMLPHGRQRGTSMTREFRKNFRGDRRLKSDSESSRMKRTLPRLPERLLFGSVNGGQEDREAGQATTPLRRRRSERMEAWRTSRQLWSDQWGVSSILPGKHEQSAGDATNSRSKGAALTQIYTQSTPVMTGDVIMIQTIRSTKPFEPLTNVKAKVRALRKL
jgi:hypothetical protein